MMDRTSPVRRMMMMMAYHNVSKQASGFHNDDDDCWLTKISSTAPESVDPGLFKKHSSFQSYTTSIATYPHIRTFFCPHPHIDKLPTTPSPLPLLVFVHGLGGSATQFNPILTSLVNVGPCFSIDFPGCGLSAFEPTQWDAYSLEALVELLAVAIERYRDSERGQKVILVGHSAGCSISATLIASLTTAMNSPDSTTSSGETERGEGGGEKMTDDGRRASESFDRRPCKDSILGLIAICPVAEPPAGKDLALHRRLLQVPGMIFDMWRRWDRRGGTESTSVARMVGAGASPETRRLQMQYNFHSRTPVWRRMAWGLLPQTASPDASATAAAGMPGQKVWEKVRVPVLLIGGEADTVTRPAEVKKILKFLKHATTSNMAGENTGDETVPAGASSVAEELRVSSEEPATTSQTTTARTPKVKAFIFPAPASHALLYDTNTFRTLCGLIQNFLFKHMDERLSLGWQLQHLTTSGKWDVKNLRKWQAVEPVSKPIGRVNDWDADGNGKGDGDGGGRTQGVFVAMKTLREVDEVHTPVKFVETWRGKIYAIIDIGHQSPVYDPAQLEKGGIQYHKFPTVSKIPPTREEVREFIALVDRLRGEIVARRQQPSSSSPLPPSASSPSPQSRPQPPSSSSSSSSSSFSSSYSSSEALPMIAVHCHYGFNRTGFFVATYMIERLGYDVQMALDEFERLRYPGIRHQHFIDTLFMRYCVGLTRATTGGSV